MSRYRQNPVAEHAPIQLPPLQVTQNARVDFHNEPTLAPWGSAFGPGHSAARIGKIERQIEQFGDRMEPDSRLLDEEEPITLLAPGTQLSLEHPRRARPSEPAWSFDGTLPIPRFQDDASSIASREPHPYRYGPPTSSPDTSPLEKTAYDYSPTDSHTSQGYYGAETMSEPDRDRVHPFVTPGQLSAGGHHQGERFNHVEDQNPAIFVSDHEPARRQESHSQWRPSSISANPPQTEGSRSNHRRSRSGPGVGIGGSESQRPLRPAPGRRTRTNGGVGAPRPRGGRGRTTKNNNPDQRPFYCTFKFAGCDSRFTSKNEWKRHVQTQHMQLCYWQCNFSTCQDRRAAFNRKDLFGQHLKRLHHPEGMTEHFRKGSPYPPKLQQFIANEIPRIQDQCRVEKRLPPQHSRCGFCLEEFEGQDGWENRMEHVGRHYENAVVTSDQTEPEHWKPDESLIRWALETKVVKRRPDRTYELVSYGKDSLCDEVHQSQQAVGGHEMSVYPSHKM